MKNTQAVGIDLGTTYSCIAWLNEHGQPVTIPNQEGELATPSAVFFDDDQPVVGTEALRNSISHPDRVVLNAKRYMGDAQKFWKIGNARYSPVHISGMILRKLIAAAQEKIGPIEEAVITVPAQFSDAQRHATLLAGHAAGLERIEMINEPVAAALCHVLGHEGLAFTELAIDQTLLVYDLGEEHWTSLWCAIRRMKCGSLHPTVICSWVWWTGPKLWSMPQPISSSRILVRIPAGSGKSPVPVSGSRAGQTQFVCPTTSSHHRSACRASTDLPDRTNRV